jgi:type VI secretion system protein ImpB
MATRESTQKKLSRVRPPRVQIEYEVHIGDAIELKELPFVLGVLGDFTGQPAEELPRLKDRKFVDLNPDNFDDVLASMKPHLAYSVANKLSDSPDAPKLKVDLSFRKLEDFEPEQVAKQVKPLRELLELRTKLADLRGSLQTNQNLDELLQDVINSSETMDKLRGEVKTAGAAEGGGNE